MVATRRNYESNVVQAEQNPDEVKAKEERVQSLGIDLRSANKKL